MRSDASNLGGIVPLACLTTCGLLVSFSAHLQPTFGLDPHLRGEDASLEPAGGEFAGVVSSGFAPTPRDLR